MCADQVEDGKVDAFHPPVLSMSIWRDSNVLDSEFAHVVIPFLRCEFPPLSLRRVLTLVPSCRSTNAMYDLIAGKASDFCLRKERRNF